MDGANVGAVVGGNVHKFRAVLGRAGAKTVQTQRELVGSTLLVVVVFTACVKLTVNEIPVPASLRLVVSKGNTASVVVNLDGMVRKGSNGDLFSIALLRLVNRVGEDLKEGMLAALKSVRAEDNAGAFPDTVGALQRLDALIVVACFCFFCVLYCHGNGSFHRFHNILCVSFLL